MIRGWCPTVHAPMPSGDGLLVRVKPFGGRLPAAALRALAEAVAAHGNGVVELTGRGNLQVRGVRDPAAFAHAMVAAGLADADPAREMRRNVVALPPCDDTLVAEAEAVMAETAGVAAKRFVVVGRSIWLDGLPMADAAALKATLLETVMAGLDPRESTIKSNVMPGLDPGIHAITTARKPGFAANTCLTRGEDGGWTPWMAGSSPAMTVSAWRPGSNPGMTLLHLPFGQTDAATLADLAARTPELRTTPWRAFLSPVAVAGFDRPSTIAACTGAPACASASVPARADAARLQALGYTNLHVSGCAKGCAHPGAARTLVGRDGRYDLVRHGHAGDPPDLRGLTLEQAAAA